MEREPTVKTKATGRDALVGAVPVVGTGLILLVLLQFVQLAIWAICLLVPLIFLFLMFSVRFFVR
jgi:hypothetical protein